MRDVGDMGDVGVMGVMAAAADEGASRSEWEEGGFLGGGSEGPVSGAHEEHRAAGRAAGLVLGAAAGDALGNAVAANVCARGACECGGCGTGMQVEVTDGSNWKAVAAVHSECDGDGERDARGVRHTGGMHVEPLLRETEKREVGNGGGGGGSGERADEGSTSPCGQPGLSIGQGSRADRRTGWEKGKTRDLLIAEN